MFITHLPRFHCHFPIFTSPTSLYNQLFFFPKSTLPITGTLFSTPKTNPISHFSSTPTLLTLPSHTHLENPENLSPPEEARIEIPIGKLFVPPETDIPSENAQLSTRILKGSNIARDAQVVQAEFVKSSVRTEDCPSDGLPEFAPVGRSNVGKSSLLNSLVRRKKSALTSKNPGKTQCINHFLINSWYLVDFPGYGYD